MTFRLSASAQEFIPGRLSLNSFHIQPGVKVADCRPVQHRQQACHALLPVNREQFIAELNISAPEFKPPDSMQMKNPTNYSRDISQRKRNGTSGAQDLLRHKSSPSLSNRKQSTPNSSRGTEIQPATHGSRSRVEPSCSEVKGKDGQTQNHTAEHGIETQRNFKVVKKKQGRTTEMDMNKTAKGDRKNAVSMKGSSSQRNISGQVDSYAGLEWRQLSRAYSETQDSIEKQNIYPKYENEAYPKLGDSSQPRTWDQNLFPAKSWSKVLQSKPCQKNNATDGSNRSNWKEKQGKTGRGLVANMQGKSNQEKGATQRWQKNERNQISTTSKNGRPDFKQWGSRDGFETDHLSSAWNRNPKPTFVGRKQQTFRPYLHGGSEWKGDFKDGERQVAVSTEKMTRNYSDMRAVRNVENFKKKPTILTEKYKFENVTKEFSERVKGVLFEIKSGAYIVEDSCGNNDGNCRGWYDFYQWSVSTGNAAIVKEGYCSICGGLSHKSSSTPDFQTHLCHCRQEPKKLPGNNDSGPLPSRQGTVRALPEFDLSQTVSELPQERSDVALHGSTVTQSAADLLGRRTEGEKSGESSVSVGNSGRELHDSRWEGSRSIDSEDEWVCVETKSKIRSKKKQLASANRQQFGLEKQKGLDGHEVQPLSGDRTLKGNGAALDKVTRANKSRNGTRNDKERKTTQGNQSNVEKKEKAKTKRKKKKGKGKEKTLYDNDQQKIIEFKMREMIEENLKMNLVELTKTRNNNEIETEKEGLEEWPEIGNTTTQPAKLMSFSEALKSSMPSSKQQPCVHASHTRGGNKIDMYQLSEEERMELRRRMWKEKRKQKKKEKKKRKKAEKGVEIEENIQKPPLAFDLGSMFDRLLQSSAEERKSSKKPAKTVLFSSGVISVASGVAKKNRPDGSRSKPNKGKPSGNVLDSTQPMKMSGKERETPRKPKMTLLKKIILRAREAKRKTREAQSGLPATENKNKEPANETEALSAHETEIDGDANEAEAAVNSIAGDIAALDVTEMEDCPTKDIEDEAGASGEHPCEPLSDLPKEVIAQLHTRKFREYCDHLLSKDINSIVYTMLKDLQRFQARAYVENPIKAKAKRRLVLGIREVAKHAKMGKLRCVIIAPNLEKINVQGGIDFYLSKIIFNCKQFNVPIVYAMNRQVLGFILNRKVPVSAIGIFSYAGVEDDFKNLCVLVEEQREKYRERVEQIMHQQSQMRKSIPQSHTGSDRSNRSEVGSTTFFINPNAPQFIPRSMAHSFPR